MIQLVRPTEKRKEQAVEFRQEFFDHGEFVINGSELFDKTEDYIEPKIPLNYTQVIR